MEAHQICAALAVLAAHKASAFITESLRCVNVGTLARRLEALSSLLCETCQSCNFHVMASIDAP